VRLRRARSGKKEKIEVKVLIAEDDAVSRRVLEKTLAKWGYDVMTTRDGAEAWAALSTENAPSLAILDLMMPHLDGLEVCRKVRQHIAAGTYIILLTAKGRKEDVVAGLDAGADDYLVKPYDRDELRARVQAGVRMLDMQKNLSERVQELENALSKVQQLQGLLPFCSYCKSIRDDQNYWQRVDKYIMEHTEARFSHSICPECYEQVMKPQIENFKQEHDEG